MKSLIISILAFTFSLSLWANDAGTVSKIFVINTSFSELAKSSDKLFLEINYFDGTTEIYGVPAYTTPKQSILIETKQESFQVILVLKEAEGKSQNLSFTNNSKNTEETIDVTPRNSGAGGVGDP